MPKTTLKQLKAQAQRAVRAACAMQSRGYRLEEKALADYARRACPFKQGDLVKARDHLGRLGYWRITEIYGVGGKVGAPVWAINALASTSKGDWAMRRQRANFREDGTTAKDGGLTLHINSAKTS